MAISKKSLKSLTLNDLQHLCKLSQDAEAKLAFRQFRSKLFASHPPDKIAGKPPELTSWTPIRLLTRRNGESNIQPI